MNGKRAKIIRKAAFLSWQELVKRNAKLSWRRVYRYMKKQYTRGNI